MSRVIPRRRSLRSARALRLALLLTMVMTVVECVVGWLSNSLALIADAGHMLTDVAALSLSLFAAWYAARPATLEKTYGYARTEILAALANGLALSLIVVWIYFRALQRLKHPLFIPSVPMMTTAAAGLAVNLTCAYLLKNQRHENLNVQGAWLNVVSDAVGSVGVIIAGLAIYWFGWVSADAIASMAIGFLIAVNSWNLVRQSVNILLEGTPSHLQMTEVIQAIQLVPGIASVHDVHLWTITKGMDTMSGHVVVDDVSRSGEILESLHTLLSQRFGIHHSTLQLEPQLYACNTPTKH